MTLNFRMICFGLICMLYSSRLGAQEVFQHVNNAADYVLFKDRKPHHRLDASDIEGSPYQNDSFLLGEVYTVKATFKNVMMRYDIYNDWVEFMEEDVKYILDPGPNILKVNVAGQSFQAQPFEEKDKVKMGFFKVLDTNTVKLMAKSFITFQDRKAAKALESSNTPAKYIRAKDQYFVRLGSAAAIPIYNVKKLLEWLPNHKKSIASFVKRKKTSLNEKELMELIAYYNNLE